MQRRRTGCQDTPRRVAKGLGWRSTLHTTAVLQGTGLVVDCSLSVPLFPLLAALLPCLLHPQAPACPPPHPLGGSGAFWSGSNRRRLVAQKAGAGGGLGAGELQLRYPRDAVAGGADILSVCASQCIPQEVLHRGVKGGSWFWCSQLGGTTETWRRATEGM